MSQGCTLVPKKGCFLVLCNVGTWAARIINISNYLPSFYDVIFVHYVVWWNHATRKPVLFDAPHVTPLSAAV